MQTQTDNKTNIQTLAYALISAGEMQGYKAAFEKVFHLIPKDTKVRLQIDSNGHIHYQNEHAPLFPAAADKAKAEAQIWEFLSQLNDRLQQYTAPENANIAHLLPSDFPQDMFAKSRYKLLSLTPVYDTYMGIRHVKHWETSLQLQVSAFKEVQLMGIKVPFAPSYPVRDATLNLTFSTGRVKNMDINFLPVNTARKEIVPLQVAAEFLKELTAERFPYWALEMRREGEWIRLGEKGQKVEPIYIFKVQNRIIPHENIMTDYSNIWGDMQKVISDIPICKILWDTYNFSEVYSKYHPDKYSILKKKTIQTSRRENGKIIYSSTEEDVIEDENNKVFGRDVYFNLQKFDYDTEEAGTPAKGQTINDINYATDEITLNENILDIKNGKRGLRANSFNKFDMSISKERIISIITMASDAFESKGNYYLVPQYRNIYYNSNNEKRASLLTEFMETFFHELMGHVWASKWGPFSDGGDDHDRIGWIPSIPDPVRVQGSCIELLLIQLVSIITQTSNFPYEITVKEHSITPKDWSQAIDKLSDILKDPFIDKTKYIQDLRIIYANKLKE